MLPWYWLLVIWLISSACLAFGMYAHGRNIGHTEAMVGEHSASHNRPKCASHCTNRIWGTPACLYKGADQGTLGPDD